MHFALIEFVSFRHPRDCSSRDWSADLGDSRQVVLRLRLPGPLSLEIKINKTESEVVAAPG